MPSAGSPNGMDAFAICLVGNRLPVWRVDAVRCEESIPLGYACRSLSNFLTLEAVLQRAVQPRPLAGVGCNGGSTFNRNLLITEFIKMTLGKSHPFLMCPQFFTRIINVPAPISLVIKLRNSCEATKNIEFLSIV